MKTPHSLRADTASQESAKTEAIGHRTADGQSIRMTHRLDLVDYVAAPDPNYSYRLVDAHGGEGFTTYFVEMTSQRWLTEQEVDRTLWKHWMTIIRPDVVTSRSALLFVDKGNNDDEPPKSPLSGMVKVAMASNSVVATLGMVPNQPLVFHGDNRARVEDLLIAYCWDKYLRTGDRRWSPRSPMIKSVVRAMDTITAFCAGPEAGGLTIDSFVVAGSSKRGWTTWIAGALDKRIVAIVPIVSDMLNIQRSFIHHWETYGFYAPALVRYEEMGIMDWQGSTNYTDLMQFEEPYTYRDSFTMPKLIINATGDEFFVPDSSQFYFDDLPGIKYLRYIPNADHDLEGTDMMETISAFYQAVIHREPLPEIFWKFEPDGTLVANATGNPMTVKLWQATNPNARDFRVETLGRVWTSTDLVSEREGVYVAKVQKPEKGWTAYMVEMTYLSKNSEQLKFSTEVKIIPDILPHNFKQARQAAAC